MGSDERGLEDLLGIKKRRLVQLKRQAARLGYAAPPELRNEIEDLEKETNSSSQVIDPIVNGELPDDIMAGLRAYGATASMNNALQLVEGAIYDLKKALTEHKHELHAVKDVVMPIVADVAALKLDNEAGKDGRRRNFLLLMLAIILLVAILALAIGTIIARVGVL